MAKYICPTCDFLYDEFFGGPAPKIEPGTKWEDLPENWHCPHCGEPKKFFEPCDKTDGKDGE